MDEIEVAEYNPCWPSQFEEEAQRLRTILGDTLIGVEHVGSTSIPGLAAKPVLDILVSVRSLAAGEQAASALATIGYELRGENGIPGRLFFRKRTVEGSRTHHLHLVEPGHEQWKSMLLFRDYLRTHPQEAQCYQVLKQDLAKQFRDNRLAYTDGKAEFVLSVLAKAGIRAINC